MALFVATAEILPRFIREPGTFVHVRVKESVFEHLLEVRAQRAGNSDWTDGTFHLLLYS